ncbi:ribonuclease H, partial [Trifolium pratense]
DGFNPAFYQRFWELCGDDIFVAASSWLERGYFPSSLNETNICLIPKCDNPISMKDLRPISQCNVLYKIVSKALANRLKLYLDKCVSQEQSAFVEGRSILDKVDWGFLRGMLVKMGFGAKWIQWMMMCVSSVNYSVLMNFDRVGPITPERGLRQGDPLSPYLLILVAEGLSALIHQVVGRGDIHGVRICRGAPAVSRLLFADDCFLFCRANVAESQLVAGGTRRSSRLACPKDKGGLGFRNFEAFNIAMVAKQVWHILQNPDTLVAKIIKARWRIDGGDKIRIMSDPWLHGNRERWILSLQPKDHVAKRIIVTPLIGSVYEDKMVWEGEQNGCYSVKSGYKLAMQHIIHVGMPFNEMSTIRTKCGLWIKWIAVHKLRSDDDHYVSPPSTDRW